MTEFLINRAMFEKVSYTKKPPSRSGSGWIRILFAFLDPDPFIIKVLDPVPFIEYTVQQIWYALNIKANSVIVDHYWLERDCLKKLVIRHDQ